MIITDSAVAMSSKRQYVGYESVKTVTEKTENAAQAVKLDLSEEAKSLTEQMKDHEAELEKEAQEKQKKSYESYLKDKNSGKSVSLNLSAMQKSQSLDYSPDDDLKLQLVKKLFQSLMKGHLKQGKNTSFKDQLKKITGNNDPTINGYGNVSENSDFAGLREALQNSAVSMSAGTPTGTRMVKTTVTSSFQAEVENTSYQAVGTAKTADGRELSFGISFEMSRSFSARNESFIQERYIQTDPLVINLDSNVASVSDMKFMFDLDADGKEEQISFANQGSGFLALDKNGDGVINDGSELFGTRSGDGFKDLSQYDEDGNGWIDEADSVFGKLKIWTKDENGNDKLLDLKSANVGAIGLQNASTQFSLNDDKNHTNGVIQKTGIYLKESGGVGTVQHVDLTL